MNRKRTANNVDTGVNEMTDNVENTVDEMTENLDNQEVDVSAEFEIDPAVMGEEFNCRRPKRFPYGIVINEETAGLFIPKKNLVKAGMFLFRII